MSLDIVFDEPASWYSLPSSTPEDFVPIAEDKASEAKLTMEEKEIRLHSGC